MAIAELARLTGDGVREVLRAEAHSSTTINDVTKVSRPKLKWLTAFCH
jgi:hypothetical protein